MNAFFWLIVGTLAVWRITHLLNAEDGPFDLLVRLRRLAGSSFFGKLLDCFYCLSLWIAAPFGYWLGRTWLERAVLWLAFSAGAILLERVTFRPEPPAPADPPAPPIYVEDAPDKKENA